MEGTEESSSLVEVPELPVSGSVSLVAVPLSVVGAGSVVGSGVDAVPFVGFRFFGVGDLGCAAFWWAAGGGV